jgi:hypothetical protein
MSRKLPADALAYYLALGPERSYQAVADRFGVSKRTVTATAVREGWQEQVSRAEARVREKAGDSYAESMQQMNERHLKEARFLQSRGLEALKTMAITNPADAIRAMIVGIEKERLVRGEPTERTENLEAIVKRQYERLFKPAGQEDWPEDELEPLPQYEAARGEESDPEVSAEDESEEPQDEDGDAVDGAPPGAG